MARVNVDECALTDPRFDVLAQLMGVDDADFARGRMIRVWMHCANRETYTLPDDIVNAIFRNPAASEWLVRAKLAATTNRGLRIRGTRGRTDYLKQKRRNARQNGKLGGRPPKPTLVPDGLSTETPLTLTPALPLTLPLKEETPTPFDPEVWFTRFWETYPRKANQPGARVEWDRQVIDAATALAIVESISKWKRSGDWSDKNYIPHPSTFLSQQRWKDEPNEPDANSDRRSGRSSGRTDPTQRGKVRSGESYESLVVDHGKADAAQGAAPDA